MGLDICYSIKQMNMNNAINPTVKRVYNLVILDESGSMESIKKPTIEGFNELIQSIKHSLKESPEIGQYVNFYSFNGGGIKEHLPLIDATHLTYLSEKNYQPDNMTPLYDAIGYAVNRLKAAIEKETDYSVLVTILTDGQENVSKEYTFEAVASLIKDLKSKGWVFTYIGANHDVETTAMNLNINNHLHFNATVGETKEMFSKNSMSRNAYIAKIKRGEQNLNENYFQDGDKV